MDMLIAFGQIIALGIWSANYVAQDIFRSFLPEAMYFLAVLSVLLVAFTIAYVRWDRRAHVRQRTEAPP
ncbi:MAG: hypothetical protein PHY45_11210 [Rhodocyclaceae bacterium]|nr:hypothetical protein [Rhodocyclaceae bacterium]